MKTTVLLSTLIALLPTLTSSAVDATRASGLTLPSGLPITLKPSPTKSPTSYFDFARIKYDAKLEMLVFPNEGSFNAVMAALDTYTQVFQLDNGNTDRFLSIINQGKALNAEFITALVNNSPLSDAVLTAFLNGNHPVPDVKRILEANLDLNERAETLYTKIELPADVRTAIEKKRTGRMPAEVILDAFERLFPGYRSLRSKTNADELKYLLKKGDPISDANPARGNSLDRTMSTVLNYRKEARIGQTIYLMLPHRNVAIKNADVKILNYMRANGSIPMNKPPPNEPANGFSISKAPPVVDANIFVQPSERQNGCGGTLPTSNTDATGRVAYHANIKGAAYYWNFGDGFVSYKQNPVHIFSGTSPRHTTTVTVYDDQGASCGPSSTGNGNSGGTTGTNCSGSVSIHLTTSGSSVYATSTVNGLPPHGCEAYSWDFDDNSYQSCGSTACGTCQGYASVNHSYQVPGQYTIKLTVYDQSGICSAETVETVNILGGSGTGGPKDCCDARDHVHLGGSTAADTTHRFAHKLALEHFFTFTCRLHTEVTSYKQSIFGFWFPSGTNSTVDLNGFVYSGVDAHDTSKCSSPNVVSLSQPWNGIWNTLNLPFGTQMRVQHNSVQSTGSAFQATSTISVSECD